MINIRGFSMIGILMAMGMTGALALVLAEMSKQQFQMAKKSESNVELSAVSQNIRRLIYDGAACIQTIGVGTVFADGGSAISINAIKNKVGVDSIVRGSTYGNGLIRIHRLFFKDIVVTGTTTKTAEINLQVIFKKTSRGITGPNKVVRKYPLSVELDAANGAVRCHSELGAAIATAKKQLCNNLQGALGQTQNYDAVNDVCPLPGKFSQQCTGENSHVVSYDVDGNPVCAPFSAASGGAEIHPSGKNCYLIRTHVNIVAGGQFELLRPRIMVPSSLDRWWGPSLEPLPPEPRRCPSGYTSVLYFNPMQGVYNNAASVENGNDTSRVTSDWEGTSMYAVTKAKGVRTETTTVGVPSDAFLEEYCCK